MCGVVHKTIHLAHLSARHLRKYILSYCEASAQIMTSALSKSQSVRRYLNNVKLHGCLERESGAHTFICAALCCFFLTSPWVNDCGMEFLIAQAFCWACIAQIVSISPPLLLLSTHSSGLLFICHVSSSDGGGGSTHGCPGAQGVEMWRPDKRASVDRHLLCLDIGMGGYRSLWVNWSHRRHTVNV